MPGFKKEDHQTMHHVMSIVASFLSGDLLDPVLNILFFFLHMNGNLGQTAIRMNATDGRWSRSKIQKKTTSPRMDEMRENRSRNRKCRTETTNAITENLLCD
jgi:hypothetical protein